MEILQTMKVSIIVLLPCGHCIFKEPVAGSEGHPTDLIADLHSECCAVHIFSFIIS